MSDPDRPGLRRIPVQARSKERVERLLEAAATLVVERGPDNLSPSDVARLAGVPVGSFYQYFNDRHDVVAVLVQRYFARVRELLADTLVGTPTRSELADQLRQVIRAWYQLHRDDPASQHLLFAILGDARLQQANIEDSRLNALIIRDALAPHSTGDDERVTRMVLVVNHLCVPALQLALAHDDPAERDAVFGAWMEVAELGLMALIGNAPTEDAD